VTNITANFPTVWHSLLIRLALQGQCTPAGRFRRRSPGPLSGNSLAPPKASDRRTQPAVGQLANAASSPPVLMQATTSRSTDECDEVDVPNVVRYARGRLPQGAPRSAFRGRYSLVAGRYSTRNSVITVTSKSRQLGHDVPRKFVCGANAHKPIECPGWRGFWRRFPVPRLGHLRCTDECTTQ
jgi:hypothetical protein